MKVSYLPLLLCGCLCLFAQSSHGHALNNKLYSTGEPIKKPRELTGFVEMQYARDIPEVPFMDEAGQSQTLTQHQGKLTLVNLWATWCAPCLREIPELQKLQQQYQGKNLSIVPISIDEETQEVRPFLNKHGFKNYSTWLDPHKNVERILPTTVVPASYFFDAKGNLVGFIRGYLDWGDKDVALYLDQMIAKYGQVTP
ncbi:MAG: TlpA family protein disulfide reductase [Shewanella sp.]